MPVINKMNYRRTQLKSKEKYIKTSFKNVHCLCVCVPVFVFETERDKHV